LRRILDRPRRSVAYAALIAAAFALAFSAGGHATATAPLRSLAENEAAARAQAPLLLARVAPPPGATPASGEPAGDGGLLDERGRSVATEAVAEDHETWIVPGTPSGALEYVAAHLPHGAMSEGRGYETGPGVPLNRSETFELGAVPGVLTARQLSLIAVQLPEGRTGLLATAAVIWTVPRTPAQAIPAGARLLTISVLGTIRGEQPPPARLAVRSVASIEAIAALLNELEAAQPIIQVCPVDFGVRVRLAFYRAPRARPLGVAVLDVGGCGGIALNIGGRAEPGLESTYRTYQPQHGRSFLAELDRVLGRKLDTRPRPVG
jgi:hypothetical protein